MEVIVCRGVEDHLSKTPTNSGTKQVLLTYKSRKATSQKGKTMSTINTNEHNNTMNTNNKEEVTMMTIEEAKRVIKESLGKRMTLAEVAKIDELRKFVDENEKQDVASINANSTVATPVTKAPTKAPTKAAKPAAASKDTKAYRTNMDAGVTKMTNEELSLKALYEKFPVVLAQGTVINLLQEAIDNGTLMELIKASADAHHSGDVLAQVKVLRINLSSKKTNLKKGIGTHGSVEIEEIRIETLDTFFNKLYEELGGKKTAGKFGRVSADSKAKYDLDDADINALAECNDIAVLTAYYNSIASFKAKNAQKTKHKDGNFCGYWSGAALARIDYMVAVINRRREIIRKGSSLIVPVYAPKPNDWYDADEQATAQPTQAEAQLDALRAKFTEELMAKKGGKALTKKELEMIDTAVETYSKFMS